MIHLSHKNWLPKTASNHEQIDVPSPFMLFWSFLNCVTKEKQQGMRKRRYNRYFSNICKVTAENEKVVLLIEYNKNVSPNVTQNSWKSKDGKAYRLFVY